ncbi:MAG TPA: 50S ribosomal protein L4 [Saprospiraceae bacterium]|jgi:large subunit ribosomal protein L4|nr:MAG: 50S ribosomal protein L4 [Candidatus Parvibacillus calidus]MBX2937592.1 50S ribosomal protein L4 [Saprospiraceae bacterium]MBK7741867.1 50S ribosomal protein L4 [Candidatus Parvibacillus calidus]MBX7177917.1 50S ribosomal protein L4 [Saprospiraceae bacterium]MCB0589945.1 50S ribosomal protein L4 [Saprospiraceae bacterium]
MKLDILNKTGASTGRSYEFSSALLEEKPNEHAVYLAVKAYLANQRQGTHKAKERSEVAGSTRKLHKQKGTGGSRKGSIKSGVLHGGARIHGPRPRDYSQDLNKKVKKVARRSVLIDKLLNNKVIIVEDFSFDTPKTKELHNIFTSLKADKKPLLVTGELNKNVYLSGRNLPKTDVTFADELNVYDMLKADAVILFEGAVDKIVQSIA